MSSSDTPREIPQWLQEPDAGELYLVAARGEGAQFPDYLEDALKRFEDEQPHEPGLELKCSGGFHCEVFSTN